MATQTYQQRISDTANDALWTGSTFNATVTISIIASSREGWFRFTNVNIPQGAEIVSAKLNMIVSSGLTSAYISAFLIPDLPVLSAATDAVPITPEVVYPYPYTDVDVTALVQQVIDQVDWASGNALGFAFRRETGTGSITANTSTNNNPDAPLLTITYVSGNDYSDAIASSGTGTAGLTGKLSARGSSLAVGDGSSDASGRLDGRGQGSTSATGTSELTSSLDARDEIASSASGESLAIASLTVRADIESYGEGLSEAFGSMLIVDLLGVEADGDGAVTGSAAILALVGTSTSTWLSMTDKLDASTEVHTQAIGEGSVRGRLEPRETMPEYLTATVLEGTPMEALAIDASLTVDALPDTLTVTLKEVR